MIAGASERAAAAARRAVRVLRGGELKMSARDTTFPLLVSFSVRLTYSMNGRMAAHSQSDYQHGQVLLPAEAL